MAAPKKKSRAQRPQAKRCGLCGKAGKLTKTLCCGHWICEDEDQYVMFSYGRNSCSRNHRTQTLCHFHWEERHRGNWWECEKCRAEFSTPVYVWFGTNDFNLRKLENPPAFELIRCANCSAAIQIGVDGYSMRGDQYVCAGCASFPFSTE